MSRKRWVMVPKELHAERCEELKGIGKEKAADAILQCRAENYFRRYRCQDRLCPSCAAEWSKRRSRRIVRGLKTRSLGQFRLALFTFHSDGIPDLSQSAFRLRDALGHVRRTTAFRGIIGGTGVIETRLTARRSHWNVHAHVIIEVQPEYRVDYDAIACLWVGLTDGHGKFSLSVRPVVDPLKASGLARYISKPDTWCPTPGTMPGRLLHVLADATKGRRLPVEWGTLYGRVKAIKRNDDRPMDHVAVDESLVWMPSHGDLDMMDGLLDGRDDGGGDAHGDGSKSHDSWMDAMLEDLDVRPVGPLPFVHPGATFSPQHLPPVVLYHASESHELSQGLHHFRSLGGPESPLAPVGGLEYDVSAAGGVGKKAKRLRSTHPADVEEHRVQTPRSARREARLPTAEIRRAPFAGAAHGCGPLP